MNLVFREKSSVLNLGKCRESLKEYNGKSFEASYPYEGLKYFKFQNTKLRFWAKRPQSYSIVTFNSSFERSLHEEIEFDNYFDSNLIPKCKNSIEF